MMSNRCFIVLSVLIAFLAISCSRQPARIQYESVAPEGWEQGDKKQFVVTNIVDSSLYDIHLLLRTNEEYPYKNLVVAIEEMIYPSHTHHVDTLSCDIFDDKGAPNGDGISLFQHSYYVTTLPLRPADSLVVTIKHDMQDTIIRGISDVGIEMSYAKRRR